MSIDRLNIGEVFMSSARPPARRLLLISNSTLHGSGYLDHAEREIRDFLPEAPPVLFVPFALFDRDAYAEQARLRFEKMGLSLAGIHRATDPGRPDARHRDPPRAQGGAWLRTTRGRTRGSSGRR